MFLTARWWFRVLVAIHPSVQITYKVNEKKRMMQICTICIIRICVRLRHSNSCEDFAHSHADVITLKLLMFRHSWTTMEEKIVDICRHTDLNNDTFSTETGRKTSWCGGKWARKSDYVVSHGNMSQHSVADRSELHSGNKHFKSCLQTWRCTSSGFLQGDITMLLLQLLITWTPVGLR